eukprot:939414-Prorocentrum_minimum.AAC.1
MALYEHRVAEKQEYLDTEEQWKKDEPTNVDCLLGTGNAYTVNCCYHSANYSIVLSSNCLRRLDRYSARRNGVEGILECRAGQCKKSDRIVALEVASTAKA